VKSPAEHLWLETPLRRDYLNIIDTVEQLVRKRGVQKGFASSTPRTSRGSVNQPSKITIKICFQ